MHGSVNTSTRMNSFFLDIIYFNNGHLPDMQGDEQNMPPGQTGSATGQSYKTRTASLRCSARSQSSRPSPRIRISFKCPLFAGVTCIQLGAMHQNMVACAPLGVQTLYPCLRLCYHELPHLPSRTLQPFSRVLCHRTVITPSPVVLILLSCSYMS